MGEGVHPLTLAPRRLSTAAAVAVVGAGVAVLFGWWREIDFLKSALLGTSSMKVNTALCFVLAGLSLWLLQREGESLLRKDWPGRLGQALALIVTLLALLSLSQDITGWDLRIDQLLFQDPSTIGAPGRMAARTALALVLLGITLLLLDFRTAKGAWPAQHPAMLAGLIGFAGVVGHAYSAVPLFRFGSLSAMAANTSVTLVFLSVGILLARPHRGMVRILTREGPGGSLARWLLPAAVLVPFGLGWLRLAGQSAGLYDTGMGTALYALTSIAILTGLVYRSALVLDRLAEQRQQAEDELKRFFSISMDLLCIAGTDGYFKVVNPRWEKVLGYSQQELLSQPYLEFIHPEDCAATRDEAGKQAAGHDVISFENRYRCRDGSYRWFDWTATAVTDRGLIYAAARDVTERKREQEELVAINRELEAFTYSVSHDLRAPLRHISGFSKMLSEKYGPSLDPTAQRYLERIQNGTRQMGLLVDDLLNLARIGRQELRRQATGLNSLVEEVLADLKPEADGRQVDWQVGRLPFADCDPALMKQVLVNLLSNALKFTRPREKAVISVTSAANDGETVITVRDNGVGFSMKYADKLFGVFQRLHRPEDFEGTGIGLATVQRILHKHGGRVWAEAELDKGATFSFTLEPTHQKLSQDKISTGAVTHDGASS